MTALSYELHKLTARLDRAADTLLREESGLTYSRFLALFAVSQGAATQRQLADWLGQSEPATSRMVAVLARANLLQVDMQPGVGNRRYLHLSADAVALVERSAAALEHHFQELLRTAGVDADLYLSATQRLLGELERQGRRQPNRVAS